MSNTKAAAYRKLRKELAGMLGFGDDIDKLPADRLMRLDILCGLKTALDGMRERQYRGEAVDTAKLLAAADALERYLPPPPAVRRVAGGISPREKLAQMIEAAYAAKELEGTTTDRGELEALQARIRSLEDENKHLRGSKPRQLPAPGAKAMAPVKPPSSSAPQPPYDPVVNGLARSPRSPSDAAEREANVARVNAPVPSNVRDTRPQDPGSVWARENAAGPDGRGPAFWPGGSRCVYNW